MLFYTLLKGIHINLYTCKGLFFCLRPGIVKTVVIGKLNPKFIRLSLKSVAFAKPLGPTSFEYSPIIIRLFKYTPEHIIAHLQL